MSRVYSARKGRAKLLLSRIDSARKGRANLPMSRVPTTASLSER
jgi:hypothetical protein